jgi:hypothetical protein
MTDVPRSNRAQTAQDFAVGISIFLLTVGFIFAFVPNLLTPFDTDVGTEQQAQADRVATIVTGEITFDGEANVIDPSETDYFGASGLGNGGLEPIQNETGLPFTARINVTVSPIGQDGPISEGGTTLSAGPEFRQSQPAASATRVVVLEGNPDCDPGCELTVRVW